MDILILIVNSILLLTATIILSIMIIRTINLKALLHLGFEKLNTEYYERRIRRVIKNYVGPLKVKMSLTEKIELYFIEKSNIRKYIPFANTYILLLLCCILFIVTFEFVYKALFSVVATSIICFLFSLIPIFFLDILGRYNSEKVRRKLAEFISVLNRWCAVKEDIFYAFERSIDSGIGEPLKTFTRDMVTQINGGIDPITALEILQMKVDNAQFRDFIINIKQNVKHRGDIRILLTNLESQFYRIEEEYNRRKISTYRDRIIVYSTMFVVLIVGYYFLKINPRVEEYYFSTSEGKSMLTLFSILFASGFFLSFRISKFKH
jgi:Flp pilus assembly protein TadB